MKIVVLDGYTLNPGDLGWDELHSLGECQLYDRTTADKVVERAQNAEILLLNKTPLPAEAIAQLSNLKYIGVLATGYNIVDIEAAAARNIPVTNVPTYGTNSVAQQTIAHILNLTNHVAHHAQSVAEGGWVSSKDWCYWDSSLIELSGLTLGIIGFGRIGRAVSEMAKAFGMIVQVNDPFYQEDTVAGVKKVELEQLFLESDVVSLHCPLTEETENLLNAQRLSLMKTSAFLINTSRGPLIDESALASALNTGQIAGAGLDVLSVEPPLQDNPLLTAKNCYITPHNSWATRASRERLMKTVIENIRSFLDGKPQNMVNL
jgi:glycerate dehydrogenase